MERWRPPPDIEISEWADENYVLSPENSSTPGRWKTHPYQRDPMNIIRRPGVRRVTFKKSSRVGFTKACINIPLAYFMACDPRSALILLPTERSAEKHSKVELKPMLRDVVPLRGLVEEGSRTSSDTILEKHYPGGIIHLGGANSSRVFRQLTISAAFCDETSDYPQSAGGEGNALLLTLRRMGDAWNSILVEGSSPKIKGACAITDSFEQSDQRHFLVPCPHCDHGQILQWGGKEFDYGIKWPSGDPDAAYYLCEQCLQPIEHRAKRRMVDQGVYQAQNPEGSWPGFHIWAAYSYLPNAAWGILAREFIAAARSGDPEKLQVFDNTIRGEAFENLGRSPSDSKLMERREAFTMRPTGRTRIDGEPDLEAMVPEGVGVLTSGTDVQADRLEVQVIGWGLGEEAWPVEYHVLYGDPTAQPLWDVHWELLNRPRFMARGGVDFIRSSAVDSNYAAQSVYSYVAPRLLYKTPDGRNAFLWAVRGTDGAGEVWPRKPGTGAGTKVPVYTIKVDSAKDQIFGRLQRNEEPGPGFIHFPDFLDETYFAQLTAEHAVDKTNQKGFPFRQYELKKGRKRNEALDTFVQAYSALCALYTMGLNLESECAPRKPFVMPDGQGSQTVVAAPRAPRAPAPQAHAPRRPQPRWVDSRKDWLR